MTAPDARPGQVPAPDMPGIYASRKWDLGPKTYTDQGFLDMIHRASGLAEFQGQAVVLDLMSGPAKVAAGLRDRSPQHKFIAVEASEGSLAKVPEGIGRIQTDVKDLTAVPLADVAVVRYGLKDIPQDQQAAVLIGINERLKPGGVLVVVDMVSPDGMKARTNRHHSAKQELSGRDIATRGRCNIPTEDGWKDLLESTGYKVASVGDYVSSVSTQDWVNGGQIDPDQRLVMDSMLAKEPLYFRQRFNVRSGEGVPAGIDFPVLVIRAEKPIVPIERELVVYGGDSTVRYSRPTDQGNNYLVDSRATFRK